MKRPAFPEYDLHPRGARVDDAVAQLNRIVEFLNTNFAKIPFILGGDFNAEIGTVSATSLTTEGYLNARSSATETVNGDESTFPQNNTVIDFIWYKSGMAYKAAATKYEVMTLEMDRVPARKSKNLLLLLFMFFFIFIFLPRSAVCFSFLKTTLLFSIFYTRQKTPLAVNF